MNVVNTVNTVGIMGRGIALQFKQAYPAMFRDYERACKAGDRLSGPVLTAERFAALTPPSHPGGQRRNSCRYPVRTPRVFPARRQFAIV